MNVYHHLLYTTPQEADGIRFSSGGLFETQPVDFQQVASIAENFGVMPQQVGASCASDL